MPSRNFYAALAVSLLLHALVLGGAGLLPAKAGPSVPAATPAMLSATLLPPAEVTPDDGPLLKNTLDDNRRAGPPPTLVDKGRQPADAQRKLAEHVYYPPQAIAEGWEGEVRLLLSLDGDGRILDVQVASGSGHDILDQAAVRAAYAAGRLPGTNKREVLLPVVFRLKR